MYYLSGIHQQRTILARPHNALPSSGAAVSANARPSVRIRPCSSLFPPPAEMRRAVPPHVRHTTTSAPRHIATHAIRPPRPPPSRAAPARPAYLYKPHCACLALPPSHTPTDNHARPSRHVPPAAAALPEGCEQS